MVQVGPQGVSPVCASLGEDVRMRLVTVAQGLLGPSATCRLIYSVHVSLALLSLALGPLSEAHGLCVSHVRPQASGPSCVSCHPAAPVFTGCTMGSPSPLHTHLTAPFSGMETEAQRWKTIACD